MADPLYHWKKHSGFKKGLLTDIVLGDEHVAKGSRQFGTTMQSDYKKKTLETEGKTAGKFSGFVISDKGQKHIMFGDAKMQENDCQDSVTKVTFKPPQLEAKVVENGSKSIREKYHAKIPTATSAAHFGSQTRQDLPIDDNHFTLRNFNTTTNDAYQLVPPTDTNRIIYGAKRSQLHFGDLGRAHNYDTVHNTSFVKHKTEPIKLKKLEYRQSAIFNSKNYDNEIESHYSTTLSDAFKGVQPNWTDMTFGPAATQKTGVSHIQFGQTKEEVKHVDLSVTKRDFGRHPAAHVVFRNPSYVRSHGIQKAMQPTDEPFQDSILYIEPSEEPVLDVSDYEPAGISLTKGLQAIKNQSSVPDGDTRYYNTGVTKSTSKDDFVGYPVAPRVVITSFTKNDVPTKHRIFNHDVDVDSKTSYKTTSQTEYIEYTKEEARLIRSSPFKPSPVSNHKLGNDAIDRGDLKTTQHAHYTAPANVARRVPQLPQLAHPNRLFPLTDAKNPTAYQSSFADYFPAPHKEIALLK